jgi:hypothetical protein
MEGQSMYFGESRKQRVWRKDEEAPKEGFIALIMEERSSISDIDCVPCHFETTANHLPFRGLPTQHSQLFMR